MKQMTPKEKKAALKKHGNEVKKMTKDKSMPKKRGTVTPGGMAPNAAG